MQIIISIIIVFFGLCSPTYSQNRQPKEPRPKAVITIDEADEPQPPQETDMGRLKEPEIIEPEVEEPYFPKDYMDIPEPLSPEPSFKGPTPECPRGLDCK